MGPGYHRCNRIGRNRHLIEHRSDVNKSIIVQFCLIQLLFSVTFATFQSSLAKYVREFIKYLVRSGPAHWGLEEIDGLLKPPGKASNLLTDHLITG